MKRRAIYIAALIAIAALSFLSGFAYQDTAASGRASNVLGALQMLSDKVQAAARGELGSSKAELAPVPTYWGVFSFVDSHYYGKKLDSTQLTYAAIQGMLGALGDRYTRLLDPDQYKRIREENRGTFEGIGAHLNIKDGRVFIERLVKVKRCPAKDAGLKPADVILKVDDQFIHAPDLEALETKVVPLIRGPSGTKVRLTIQRKEVPEPFDVDITRAEVQLPSAEDMMEDDLSKIGRIILRRFNETSDQQLDRALTNLEEQNMRALILDLRGNPGGLLEVAVDIGSRFIPKGDILIIQDKGGRREHRSAEPPKRNHRMYPLAVLVDRSSASASEIIAGAIQYHKAGILVGTDTFGKGSVQTILNLEGGAAVAITTAKYYTPGGRDVNKDKIHPDVVVEFSDEDLQNENDVQLKRAVQLLKERLGDHQAVAGNETRKKS